MASHLNDSNITKYQSLCRHMKLVEENMILKKSTNIYSELKIYFYVKNFYINKTIFYINKNSKNIKKFLINKLI